MAIVSQKRTCGKCKCSSVDAQGVPQCSLGYPVTEENEVLVPLAPCPKPTTWAALDRWNRRDELSLFGGEEAPEQPAAEEPALEEVPEEDAALEAQQLSDLEDCADREAAPEPVWEDFPEEPEALTWEAPSQVPEETELDQHLDRISEAPTPEPEENVVNLDLPLEPEEGAVDLEPVPEPQADAPKSEAPQVPPAVCTRYLIDTENLGRDWMELLEADQPGSIYYLLYTTASPNVPLSAIPAFHRLLNEDRLRLIACNRGTPNALDFQLVFLLGRLLEQCPEDRFVILSKDHGYDAVADNQELTQGRVRRITGQAAPKKPVVQKPVPKKPVVQQPPAPAPVQAEPAPKQEAPLDSHQLNRLLQSVQCPPTMLSQAIRFAKEAMDAGATPEERAKLFKKALVTEFSGSGQSFYDQHSQFWVPQVFTNR